MFLPRRIADAQAIVDEFTSAMHRKGMRWKASSMQDMTVGHRTAAAAGATRQRPTDEDGDEAGDHMTWADDAGR